MLLLGKTQNNLSSVSHSKLQFFASSADWGQLLFVHWMWPRRGGKAGAAQCWASREIPLPTPSTQNYHKPLNAFPFCCSLCVQPVMAILLWSLSEPQPLISILCREFPAWQPEIRQQQHKSCLEFQTLALQIALVCKIKQFITIGSGFDASVVGWMCLTAAFQRNNPAPWSCAR